MHTVLYSTSGVIFVEEGGYTCTVALGIITILTTISREHCQGPERIRMICTGIRYCCSTGSSDIRQSFLGCELRVPGVCLKVARIYGVCSVQTSFDSRSKGHKTEQQNILCIDTNVVLLADELMVT